MWSWVRAPRWVLFANLEVLVAARPWVLDDLLCRQASHNTKSSCTRRPRPDAILSAATSPLSLRFPTCFRQRNRKSFAGTGEKDTPGFEPWPP